MEGHRAGFVNIIGAPNVGKSTLLNNLLGEGLSIITPKAQTTRHRLMGILNGEGHQAVLSDTPGILDPQYKLHESMLRSVDEALEDADLILLVTDASRKRRSFHPSVLQRVRTVQVPVIVLINKIDLSEQKAVEEQVSAWKEELEKADVWPVSALHAFHIQELRNHMIGLLPNNPPYFPKDDLTDKPVRFFVAEIIREKILSFYQEEVPYSCEVVVREYEEKEALVRIKADIMVLRPSQRSILLGEKGKAIKKLGIHSRRDIETLVGKKVHLDLQVKVDENWRDDSRKLRKYGYSG
ncbi:MAG: GTPase Era [Flavobacteriales bacterium]